MSQVRVKICGITNVEDAIATAEAGADAIGLVFYPPSSRYVPDLGLAREIAQVVGPFVTVVALTVNLDTSKIEEILNKVPINLLQFHGDEQEPDCQCYAVPYIKALRMKDDLNLEHAIAAYSSAQGVLLDTYVKGVPGGTGASFNWERVPHNANKPIVLAGGLNPSNVAEAVVSAKPYAVDVSGGVEHAPGLKDANKVKEFVLNAKRGAVN